MNIHDLSAVENESIWAFVESCSHHLTGRVLDFGCGEQPYRPIVERAGGEYVPYDMRAFGGNRSNRDIAPRGWQERLTAILCTQVIQYVYEPAEVVDDWAAMLPDGGHLVLTYPSAWPVIRDELWHFTQAGMEYLLCNAGFTVLRHELRHALGFDGFSVPMGYACLART